MLNKSVVLLFISRFISFFGDGVYFIAINWLIVKIYESTLALGSVSAISAIPNLLIIPVIGVLVDKYARKKLVFSADLIRGLLIATLAIIIAANKFNIGILYPINIIIGVCSSFYWIGYNALISDSIEKKNLTKFYSLMAVAYQSGYLLGSTTAGFIMDKIGITGALVVDVVSFFISSICISIIPIKKQVLDKDEMKKETSKKSSYFKEIKEGLFILKENRPILITILLGIPITIFISMVNIIEPIFVSDVLNGTSSDFGFIDAALGIGAILGAMLVKYLCKKNCEKKVLYLGYLLISISFIVFGIANSVNIAIVINTIVGISYMMTSIIYQSQVQFMTDNKVIGRVTSVQKFLQNICSPIMTMSIGYLGVIFNYRILIILVGLVYICLFIVSSILIRGKLYNFQVEGE